MTVSSCICSTDFPQTRQSVQPVMYGLLSTLASEVDRPWSDLADTSRSFNNSGPVASWVFFYCRGDTGVSTIGISCLQILIGWSFLKRQSLATGPLPIPRSKYPASNIGNFLACGWEFHLPLHELS